MNLLGSSGSEPERLEKRHSIGADIFQRHLIENSKKCVRRLSKTLAKATFSSDSTCIRIEIHAFHDSEAILGSSHDFPNADFGCWLRQPEAAVVSSDCFESLSCSW